MAARALAGRAGRSTRQLEQRVIPRHGLVDTEEDEGGGLICSDAVYAQLQQIVSAACALTGALPAPADLKISVYGPGNPLFHRMYARTYPACEDRRQMWTVAKA